jgi:endonuclease VIII
MPEGDTIFRAARTLHRALADSIVTRFESVYPQLTRVADDTPIIGRLVERVESQGKHLLMRFSGDLVLRTHMRMSGSWHIYRPDERWHRSPREMRVLVATERFVAVGFNIPVAEFETTHTLRRDEALGSLGPDLLSPAFDEAEALRRMRRQASVEIGPVLLNQRVVAGIGNVFKSETLFLCGVHPFTRVSQITDQQLVALLRTGRRLLGANVLPSSKEGITTYTGLRARSIDAEHSDRLWVYGRGNKPCRRCDTPIAARKQGLDARITYWCPRCQVEQKE